MFNTPSKCNGCPALNNLERTIKSPQAAAEAAIGRQIANILGDRIVLQGGDEIGPQSPMYGTTHAQQVEGQMNDLVYGCPGLQPGGLCGNEAS
jgi:hypothetical protein